ncbi:hypothetical protein BU24DRAFT_417465 [Aaosphaeria arxii CBS 175.79]|uniref:F-box domain-containing protein n=1 Tax=Aaosphaeria arxii CBS 175.79 TaxID=1450172 RepID=A0A6A5Y989_9PLEO|nr:uncharacterized protein BU24DRAFT_417465 [Aaosphaeria arxii CBS 175.79]KAF2021826.1 hypothetical protein BU24DRAFT_417465 [Aaosphaeria arxii CBS 175.79]
MPASCCSPASGNDTELQQPMLRLPDELLKIIASYLSTEDLRNTALVSTRLYPHASELLWRSVSLIDTWRDHEEEPDLQEEDEGLDFPDTALLVPRQIRDDHDDTPIIQKLYLLAKHPHLAAQVHILTHRCHLPTPTIFSEIPFMHFHSDTLSCDQRLHRLLRLAIKNLVNVQTLRIIYGHWHITRMLLEGLLDTARDRPLRRLWLESCSLADASIDFGATLIQGGLESLRIRRLRAESNPESNLMKFPEYTLDRGGFTLPLHDGAGGWLSASVRFSDTDAPPLVSQPSNSVRDKRLANFEAAIWSELPEIEAFLDQHTAHVLPIPLSSRKPNLPILQLLSMSTQTLTKLNLDWILWRPNERNDHERNVAKTFHKLSKLRFPHLRAFQVRNAVVPMTNLPRKLYLLETVFLEFLEAHPRIQCLSWPLDRFYSHHRMSEDINVRCRAVVATLGKTLIDLRLDSYYSNSGELISDNIDAYNSSCNQKIRRRRFISEFAPFMRQLESIKLEGGIPRDEKREILRALHHCSLKKLVMIGVAFPAGNTWGDRGRGLRGLDPGLGNATYDLQEEDRTSLTNLFNEPLPRLHNFKFSATYGWPPGYPFLHTIATHHADTLEELKLCGYNGSPILSDFLPITEPLLYPLRHFHKLRQLIISLWLLTYFEHGYRDSEIIQSWKNSRSSPSKAPVVITPPADPALSCQSGNPTQAPHSLGNETYTRPQHFDRWAVALKTKYSSSALAYRVANDIGPHLSEEAKSRPGGVRVRASFCLGARDDQRWANDIFDLDIRIGEENRVLEFVGPREEGEEGRWWDKLENRRWF